MEQAVNYQRQLDAILEEIKATPMPVLLFGANVYNVQR